MKISDFTREQLQFFLDNEKKIKKELQSKKYDVGDCFISFMPFTTLRVLKITSVYKNHYKCTYIYNNFWNAFDIEKRSFNNGELDSYIKIESSLYESIESFVQKYNQRRDTDYNQLSEKYKNEMTDYIKTLEQEFK